MNLSQADITNHALKRFKLRWHLLNKKRPNNAKKLLKGYLKSVEEVGVAKRGRKIGIKFVREEWVFIFSENLSTLITVYIERENS